jgi:hypothetical protein
MTEFELEQLLQRAVDEMVDADWTNEQIRAALESAIEKARDDF